MSPFYGILFSLFTALVVIVGDTLIKVAADGARLVSPQMFAGALLYGASAFLWYFAMRHVTLAQAAVAYSMLTLIALCIIGAVAFGETIGPRELLGVTLALAAMVAMTHQAQARALNADTLIPADLAAGDTITIEFTSTGDDGVASVDALVKN